MAQVIIRYTAKLASDAYIYDSPDISSDHVRWNAGTPIELPADYLAKMRDEFYPVLAPSGWILYYNVGDIEPVYGTTTDKCAPPTSVVLSGDTLVISGGAGGDLNAFSGYGVSWRDKPIGGSYGEWSGDAVANTTSTAFYFAVSAPAGMVREFRVRTLGSAGAEYYSDYVVCGTTLTGNTAPYSPAIVRPAANAVTYSTTPVVVLVVTADADDDDLVLKRRIDSGSWETVKTLKSGTVHDKLPMLSVGNHTVYYQLTDPYMSSEEVSVAFGVESHAWKRVIETGTIISNSSVSHVADINELLSAVNKQRAFYGLSDVALPSTVGRFSDWKPQMEKLAGGVNDSLAAAGQDTLSINVPSWPAAAVINSIRTASKAV